MEPIAVLLALALFGLPWLVILALWRARRSGTLDVIDRAHLGCAQCGYDLRGSLSFCRCPECGRPFEVRGAARETAHAGARSS